MPPRGLGYAGVVRRKILTTTGRRSRLWLAALLLPLIGLGCAATQAAVGELRTDITQSLIELDERAQLRLEQLEARMAQAQAQLASGDLTPEEFREAILAAQAEKLAADKEDLEQAHKDMRQDFEDFAAEVEAIARSTRDGFNPQEVLGGLLSLLLTGGGAYAAATKKANVMAHAAAEEASRQRDMLRLLRGEAVEVDPAKARAVDAIKANVRTV